MPKRAFQPSADDTGTRHPADGTVAEATSGVQLIAIASDQGLLDMLRGALDSRQRVWRADDATQAADLLLAAPSSVMFIDVAVTQADTGALVERLHAQFPGLQVIVTGRRDDEAALSSLISSGAVFRFLHKPASNERMRNFVAAAIRRCAEQPPQPLRPAASAAPAVTAPPEPDPEPALPKVAPASLRPQLLRRAAVGLLLVAVLLAAAIVLPRLLSWLQEAGQAPRTAVTPAETSTPATDPALQQQLDQAALAQDTGRLAEPFGENAIELYRAALRIDPGNEQAAQGLSLIAATLLTQAEVALLDGDLAAAASALDTARSASPADPRVGLLSAELALARERLARGQVSPPAVSAPAAAPQAPGPSPRQPPQATQAPAETAPPEASLETLRSEHARLLALANQRIAQGRLVEPEADSAHHYLDLLLAADPAFAGVAETAQLLGERLIQAAQQLADGDRLRESERMLAVAGIVGVPAADIAATRGAIAARRAPVEPRVLPESALVRTRSVATAYPARAAAQGVEGWVEVEFTVGTDGRTRDALVTGSSPPGVFDQAAAAAIARWRYQPQVVDGQAVDQRVAVRLRFSLDDR